MAAHDSAQSEREDGPIRSVKDFIKRYFPNAVECPHCNGTGMKRGSDTTIDIPKWKREAYAAEIKAASSVTDVGPDDA